MSDTKTLKEMSLEELDVRGAELRSDLCELSEGTRSDDTDVQMRKLLGEVDVFDAVYTLARAQASREAAERAAALAAQQYGPAGANGDHGVRTTKPSIGELIVLDEHMKQWVDGGMSGARDAVGMSLMLKELSGRDITEGLRAVMTEFAAGGPGNGAANGVSTLLPVGQPIAPVPRVARLALRDLIPSSPTVLPVVPYVRELNPVSLEGGASATLEGNVKPDAALSMTGANAPITTIAVNVSPTRQLWDDAALVVAYINQRLPYLVRVREDAEFLNGSGTWPDVTGLRNATGKQSRAAISGEFAQTIGMSIALVENVDGTASGVVFNPIDAWTMFTKRAAGGSGTFDAGNPFSVQAVDSLTVWGLPTVRSRVYPQGVALVGDYARGAMILDRQGVNVQVYPQHSDYAARNQILVQCEERAGLAIWRPDVFVEAALA